MDELKQSVQLAVHEQKDPLVIYKEEAYKLFRKSLTEINREVISFLLKAELPQQNPEVAQQRIPEPPREQYIESKAEILNTEEQLERAAREQQAQQAQQVPVTETITRDAPKINRNDNVTIQNIMSGETETMKYKKAEALLNTGEWVLTKTEE